MDLSQDQWDINPSQLFVKKYLFLLIPKYSFKIGGRWGSRKHYEKEEWELYQVWGTLILGESTRWLVCSGRGRKATNKTESRNIRRAYVTEAREYGFSRRKELPTLSSGYSLWWPGSPPWLPESCLCGTRKGRLVWLTFGTEKKVEEIEAKFMSLGIWSSFLWREWE